MRLKENLSGLLRFSGFPGLGGEWRIAAVSALGLLAWLVFFLGTERFAKREEELGAKLARASELSREIGRLSARRPALADMTVQAAVRRIVRDTNFETRMVAFRPAEAGGGREGVDVTLERLNLSELLALLREFRERGGLGVASLTVGKRHDNPALADLQITLARQN